jgi:molybdate transport system permease protein
MNAGSGHWQVIEFTLLVCLGSSFAILAPGTLLAWWLAKSKSRWKILVETVVFLPLVVPPVATGLILLDLFGRRGPLGSAIRGTFGVDIAFTWRAVLIATAVMSFPLLVRSARVGFDSVNPRLEQIANTLGASPFRVFFTITLPLALRGILAGFLLSFARAVGEFGATILVAGNIPGKTTTLSLSIYSLVQLGKDEEAFGLAAISVLIAFGAVFVSELLLRQRASSK